MDHLFSAHHSACEFRRLCFAIESVQTIRRGNGCLGLGCWVDAYQRVYRGARSRAGARASVSRLMRHPDVKAARADLYNRINALATRPASSAPPAFQCEHLEE